jgi:acyl-CoA thioesterase I
MPDRQTQQTTALGYLGWTAAACIVLAALHPARAEMAAAQPALPAAVVPASTAAPLPIPALAAPNRPQPQDADPEALRPQAAPLVRVPPSDEPSASAEVVCRAPTRLTRLEHPLRRTARRLASGQPLVIVAIGSSSTAGAGASSPAASYPSRLAVELQKLLRGHDITVLNRGVNGEETPNMMARFSTGVIAEHPQLVLWQVGTNSVLRDHPLRPHAVELHHGIEELKETGADVVLIDPQYAPRVLAKAETFGMIDQIALTAHDENVDLFRRFAIMHDWYENQHHAFDVFMSRDGLHMNDWGYACWAKLLAAGIAQAASPPVASLHTR